MSNPLKKTLLSKTLKGVFGIGTSRTDYIFKQMGFCKNLVVEQISSEQTDALNRQILSNNIKTEQELRKIISKNSEKLVEIKSQRGLRRLKGYPVRGQRTHSNGRTSKKKRLGF